MAFVQVTSLQGTSAWNVSSGNQGYITVPFEQYQAASAALAQGHRTAVMLESPFGLLSALRITEAFDLGGTYALAGQRGIYDSQTTGTFNSQTRYRYFLPLQEIQLAIDTGEGGGGEGTVQSITGSGTAVVTQTSPGVYNIFVPAPGEGEGAPVVTITGEGVLNVQETAPNTFVLSAQEPQFNSSNQIEVVGDWANGYEFYVKNNPRGCCNGDGGGYYE